jgi:aspartyl/asparaginyl beta-hydroxylase (cupin superfamily)
VLAEDPYDFVAVVSKGALLEKLNKPRLAAQVYKTAVTIAPARDRVPPGLLAPLQRAEEVVAQEAGALKAHLQAQLEPLRASFPDAGLARFDEGLDIFCGLKKPFVQQPILLNYPRLAAIPFFDRSAFPWLADLEAATDAIRADLQGLLDHASDDFEPYIAYPPGAPVNQWGELNHSKRWSAIFLWRDGVRQDAVCERCPNTLKVLESLPLAYQPGFAPTVMFSALEPHTHIPPHTGSANTRLLVHLPLVLPGPSRFRVGNETREWRMGEAWVFDDTIEHEAWNDADALRVILIFDIWNPDLSEAERALITAMMTAKNAWQTA